MKKFNVYYSRMLVIAGEFFSLIAVSIIVTLIYIFTEIIPTKNWCIFIIAIYVILRIISLPKKLTQKPDKLISKNNSGYATAKARLNNRINSVKDTIFKIKEMYLSEKPYVITIVFHNKLMPNVIPEVYFEETKISVEVISTTEILCYLHKSIKTKTENFNLRIGKNEYDFINPYYIDLNEISKEGNIIWQCEGHLNEKYIYISKNCFPNLMKEGMIIFSLFFNNKFMGEFTGKYVQEKKCIVVPIPSINKNKCLGKKCILKPYNDDGVKITLPKPEVILVNGRVK